MRRVARTRGKGGSAGDFLFGHGRITTKEHKERMDGMYRNTKFFVFLRALDREIAALPQRETEMGRNGANDQGACAVMRRFGKQGG